MTFKNTTVSKINKEWVEADLDEPTDEISTDQVLIPNVINPKATKHIDFDEDNVDV